MIKIAVFASGSGTNAENVASYFAAGEKARVTLILSNRPDAPVLERARRLGIGTEIFDRDTFYNSDRVVERSATSCWPDSCGSCRTICSGLTEAGF